MTATDQPGIVVLMGSGETTPTMVTIHKTILERTAERTGGPVRASLLNTPYGFQENAEEITSKAQHYFDHNVGQDVGLVDVARLDAMPASTVEARLDDLRQSDWLFAGPGSPSYAMRQWDQADVGAAMVDVVEGGGTLILASAAAVTAGSHAVPVYEVYKAGADAYWVPGLDLMQVLLGWSCVVIPHFDNAEGGTHDTRFCYMGERRLSVMERELADDSWILGIDEHTACIIDLAQQTVTVQGRGAVYVRHDGQIVLDVESGDSIAMAILARAWSGERDPRVAEVPEDRKAAAPAPDTSASPLLEQLASLRQRFEDALEQADADAATASVLDTQSLIMDWSADSLASDEMDRAVAQLRAMITRLGSLAGEGLHDHDKLIAPLIETLLHVRDDARASKAYEVADHIRGHMDTDGVRVKDTREGTEWEWDQPPL